MSTLQSERVPALDPSSDRAEPGERAEGAEPAERAERPMRADAARNRVRLLDAGAAAFAAHGIDASLEDVARKAGVGVGTLYRHFPTRDALMEAVYRHQVESLCESATRLMSEQPADAALEAWMEQFVAYVATKRGMAMALKAVIGKDSELFAYCHGRIRSAAGELLTAAAASGAIRPDVDSADLVKALSGICLVSDQDGWQEQARRLVRLFHDGLRYGAPTPAR